MIDTTNAQIRRPAEFIKGIHEPIVSEYVFQKVQDVLSAGKKNKVQYKSKNLAQYPLRGLILCELCGNNLSASSPKGNGGHYDYYHCANGCKKSFRTELLHNELETILTSLKPKPEVIEVYTKLLSEGFKIKNGNYVIPNIPGTGIEWNEENINKYKV